VVWYKGFLYQAASWKTARRVVAKVEFHFGEIKKLAAGCIITGSRMPKWKFRRRREDFEMFVGHYGPSFAGNALKKSIPLWVLFVAVQLLDVFWSVFVLLGVEKVRIVPGITKTNPLDLYYMPYTHSLDGALVFALAAGLAYWLLRRVDGWLGAAVVSAAVFSHWILVLLGHKR
jgi:hypothetical protein